MYSWHFKRNILVLGDIFFLMMSLPVTLILRHFSIPDSNLVIAHIAPFTLIAIVSITIFFSAGLYDRSIALIRREIPGTIFGVQIVNATLAALLFFFVPIFNIAPKTNLVIYLLVSTAFVSGWRFLFPVVFGKTKLKTAVVIGEGEDVDELVKECKKGELCPLSIKSIIPSSSTTIVAETEQELSKNPDFVIANIADPKLREVLPYIVNRMPGDTLIDFTSLYESVFRKVPLSSLSYSWFVKHADPERILFDVIKRMIDIILGIILLVIFVLVTPIVFVLIKLETKGSLFILQERVGVGYKKMRILKFRTMTSNEQGSWVGETDNKVTRVGSVLRRASIDELPQILSVLAGSLSLIGPRSDIDGLSDRLAEAIPFYKVRYRVRPGITGWAQVNQKYASGNISPQSVEESKVRLQYDLYYIKHRSPFLDLSIAFRTFKTLISRVIPNKR